MFLRLEVKYYLCIENGRPVSQAVMIDCICNFIDSVKAVYFFISILNTELLNAENLFVCFASSGLFSDSIAFFAATIKNESIRF